MRIPFRPFFVVSIAMLVGACSSASSAGATPTVATGSPSAPQVSAGAQPASGNSTQTSNRASVTIDVTWAGPTAGAVFEVKMDNHMIDLSSVDLTAATLTNDRGEKLSRPTWEGGASGHHREGKLTFGGSSAALFADASWVELELPAVGDSSLRDFKWALSK